MFKLDWTAPDGFFGSQEYETLDEAEEAKKDFEREGCFCSIEIL